MNPTRRLPILVAGLFLAAVFLSVKINSSFKFPFPPFNELVFDLSEEFKDKVSIQRPLGSEGGFRDFGGVLFGLRRLTADIGWIAVLQYYGAHEEGGHEEHFGEGNYSALEKLVLRVVRLDPSFLYAYLYGAGSLAFNLNRPDQAMDLLKEGIEYNPTYWRFRLYVGAIVYKQKGRFDEMLALLEDAIKYPDCPTLIKSVLANLYKDRKNYTRALDIWMGVLESGESDATFQQQAKRQIEELRQKLGI